jgi:O-acetyl-ADP-ribose deacetylase (regulator of RNase III)
MGELIHKSGDIFLAEPEIIVHGVNCKGVFNAGFAREVAKRFPEVKRRYMDRHKLGVGWKPGDTQFCYVQLSKRGCYIVNAATQNTYVRTGVHVDYNAVSCCFAQIAEFCDTFFYPIISCPRIGSGLAGGDWGKIEEIIRLAIADKNVNVEVYTL